MKFTTFVLASAAATASAQFTNTGFNTGFNGVNNPFLQQQQGFVNYGIQYPVQYPVNQPTYQIQQPVDPLAWERDCTWINSVTFRAALSRATCGAVNCATGSPNGNGGGHKRQSIASTTTTGYHVWGSVINRAGRVCAVAYTGSDLTRQFPYGRILAMKLANTANSLSLPKRAMPSHVRHFYPANNRGLLMNGQGNVEYGQPGQSANTGVRRIHTSLLEAEGVIGRPIGNTQSTVWSSLTAAVAAVGTTVAKPQGNILAQATQWMYTAEATSPKTLACVAANNCVNGVTFATGLGWRAESQWYGFTLPAEQFNPGNVDVHYQGAASNYGEACGTTRQDPMCMQKPGGMAYSAGGLSLYDAQGYIRGAIGVAGDNDCTNHAIAWKARQQLNLDYTPGFLTVKGERNDVYGAGVSANAALKLLADRSLVEVHWAGAFAEDNAIFDKEEAYLFPKCHDLINRFMTSNPTRASPLMANQK